MKTAVPIRRLPAAVIPFSLVLVVAGLVAIASNGPPVWRLLRQGPAYRPEILIMVAGLCAFGLVLAAIVTVVVHRAIAARRRLVSPLRTSLLRAAPITAATLAILGLMAIASMNLSRSPDPDVASSARLEFTGVSGGFWAFINDWRSTNVRPGEGGPEETEAGPIQPLEQSHRYLFLAIAAIVAALAAAAVWRWYSNRSAADEQLIARIDPADAAGEAVLVTLADTIDAMLADPDPNTAIRGAYARLLEGLDARGTGRRPYEGPVEHLSRVLGSLRVRPNPLQRLVELFELARFSTHSMTSAHRDQALSALRSVAADLQDSTSLRVEPGDAQPAAARP